MVSCTVKKCRNNSKKIKKSEGITFHFSRQLPEAEKMGLPHVTSFCWCMGLEMGTKFIGFVHLAVSIVLIILCSVFAQSARSNIGTVEDAGDHLYTKSYKVAVTIAGVTTAHVLLAATLLISAFKRSTTGLKIWLWVMGALCSAAILFILVEICMHGISGSGSEIFLSFLEGVIFFGAVAYSILCVYSYYLMLRSAEDMSGPKTVY